MVYPLVRPQPKPVEMIEKVEAAVNIAALLEPLPDYVALPVTSPSSAHEHAGIGVLDSAVERLVDADAARKEGLALHALLQHLGKVDPALWPLVVPKAMPVLLPGAAKRHRIIGDRAISILSRPELAHIFGPNSRAEVPFLLDAWRHGAPTRLAGRIDRLVVDGSSVLVVDYKSDAARARWGRTGATPLSNAIGTLCAGCRSAVPRPYGAGGNPVDGIGIIDGITAGSIGRRHGRLHPSVTQLEDRLDSYQLLDHTDRRFQPQRQTP